MKQNRSVPMREALREHRKGLEIRSSEQRDRAGYARQPQSRDESALWEVEVAWPDENGPVVMSG